ncbi:MAG: hypothetical protein AAF840_00665, partial [Bacteroidota bacterium]
MQKNFHLANLPFLCTRGLALLQIKKEVNHLIRLLSSFCLFFLCLMPSQNYAQAPTGERQKLRINLDWRFHLGEVSGDPTAVDYDDSNWERVAVPHTPELVSL